VRIRWNAASCSRRAAFSIATAKDALGKVDEDKPTKFELIFEERHNDEGLPPQVN